MPMKRQWLIIFFPENSMEERCSAIKGLWKQRKIKEEKNFWSEVYQNLGAAYVQMFQFHKSYKAYNTAFKLNEDPRILEKIYLLTCFTSGLSVDESYESLFKPELKEEWKQKLAQAELTTGQAEGLKTLRAMWKQDPSRSVRACRTSGGKMER